MFALSTTQRIRVSSRPARRHTTTRRVIASVTKPDRNTKTTNLVDAQHVPTRRRRTVGQTLSLIPKFAPLLLMAHGTLTENAHAAGWYNDVTSGGGFIGGGDSFGAGGEGFGADGGEAEYDYRTKDLAVDLASPLVAYKVVSWALKQEVPVWLDAITLFFVLAAVYVCLFDVNDLDDVLV